MDTNESSVPASATSTPEAAATTDAPEGEGPHAGSPEAPAEPRSFRPGECRGCGAKILWARTAKQQKWVPMDAKPLRVYVQTMGATVALVTAYVAHHATCPKAATFRRKE